MVSTSLSNYAYCQLWNLIPQAALLYTPEGQLVDCNQNALTLYGYSREDLLTCKFLQLVPLADQPRVEAQQAQLRQGESYSLEVHHLKQTGESFPVQIKVQWLQTDDQLLLLALVEDRTLWGQTQDRLANLEAAMRQLGNNKLDALCLLDHELKCVYINHAFETTFGYDFNHIYNAQIDNFFHPDELETFQLLFKLAQLERVPIELTSRFKHQLGHYIWAEISATTLWNEQDQFVGFSFSLRDITLYIQVMEEEDIQRKQAQTLANAALALTTHLEVDKVLHEILIQTQQLVPHNASNIALLEGDMLQVRSTQGYDDPSLYLQSQPLDLFRLDKRAIETRQAIIVTDTQQDPFWLRTPETDWICSFLVIPLFNAERVLGCLRLDSDKVGSFTSQAVNILQPLANVAAVALEKALLHQHLTQELELRRRTEEHLRLLEAAIHHAKDAIAITGGVISSQGPTVELINPAFTLMTGYDSSQLIGKNLAQLIDLSFNQTVLDDLIHNLNQGKPFEGRLKTTGKTGDPLFITWTTAPIQNAEGEITHFITILHDVTAQELQTQAIEDMRQTLRSTLDSLTSHIAVLNPKGEIILVNEAWRNFAQANGAPENEDYLGHNYLAVCESASGKEALLAKTVSSAIRAIVAGEQADFQQEYPLPDGIYPKWFSMRITPFDEPAPRRVVIAHTSITERVLAENALRASEENYRRLVEGTDSVICLIDGEGTYLFVNEVAAQNMNRTPETLMGKKIHDIFPPEEANFQLADIRRVIQTQKGEIFENPITVGGEIRWYNSSIQPIRDGSGQVAYAMINARDVTSRKKMELNLEHMIQRLKALHAIDSAILHARSVDEVAQKAAVHLQQLIGCKRVSFIHFETDSSMGHVRAVAPLSEEALELGRWLMYSSFYLNRLRNHEVIVVDHPNEMPFQSALGKAWRREGLGSSIQIPLVNDGTLFSLFSLEDTNPYFFTKAHVDMVQEIANAVAVAMRQNQLNQAVQKYTLELEQRVEARTQELNHAKERVEAILDSSGDGIILVDLQRGIQQTNPAFDTLFEADEDHYFGTSLVSLTTPDFLPVLQASIQRVVESKQMERVELQAQSSKGQVFDINLGISPIVTIGEPVTALVCSLQDITQRKQIERQLRYHASLQETVTDAVVVTDPDFRVQSWNRAAERLYGWQTAEAIGKPLSDLFKSEFIEEQNTGTAIQKLHEQGYWTGEVQQTCRDGSRLIVLSSVVLLKDETGFAYGVVAVNHDITSRKQSEETLKLALAKEKELGELKSRFVSMASHEFRTPLATILATADTLDAYRHRMDETDITRRLGKIRQQVMNLKGIIDDVLTLSRIQAGQADFKPTATDMRAFLEDILEEFQSRPDVTHRFAVALPSQILEASVDQKWMRQVVSNLISNALKYSSSASLVSVKLEPAGETFIFSIQDEGIGIPDEDREHLFQAFHRASNVGTISGTGLGLSIIREAIELHHGTIQLESKVGSGSLFKVTVPLKQNFQGESDESATTN